ncbi:hypothetical protein Nepgr_009485 [Nepenthes gracilis]|uniref:Uncharacterized protein n=1 Tax=Nepenthes gracilis TaxID=150966 RepID=A0AAD3SB83_NEPGR|nr:hypothetical protein Nepgr_009485 [Nepenthes gracilis]
MRAVGIVTQTGKYFFLASGLPGFGSGSAMATLAMEHAAAAAAANTRSLLFALPSSFLSVLLSPESATLVALATRTQRRAEADGCLETVEAEAPRKEAVIVTEAISVFLLEPLLPPVCLSYSQSSRNMEFFVMVPLTRLRLEGHPLPYPKKCPSVSDATTCSLFYLDKIRWEWLLRSFNLLD